MTLPADTKADRKVLLDHLQQSSSKFLDSVKGLTPEQWNYKPAPERWSVAECAEHIALSEDFIRDTIENKVLKAPATPDKVAERKMIDEKILPMITNRTVKATAPEPLVPSKKFATPAAAISHFKESRAKTVALAKTNNELREHAGPHPVFKEADAYQWLLYLSGHSARHTAQILEVKADAGFPKK
jgi:DinB family protein